MIYINFGLRNPFSDRWETTFYKDGFFSWFKNKAWEIQGFKDTTIISFEFRLTTRQDHAGIQVGVGLLGYSVSAQYYDTRHWNDENNCWVKYN